MSFKYAQSVLQVDLKRMEDQLSNVINPTHRRILEDRIRELQCAINYLYDSTPGPLSP
jgi:hypothetical protein